nr:retrovirus-related Pol polyprotein from transposon TNT 1-94 [Tanacetum cinerariifolium]
MENEQELRYETFTRVYLGSYEHYKGVGAEVELLEPGIELQGSKMVEMDFFNDPRIIREQRIAAYKGYRGGGSYEHYKDVVAVMKLIEPGFKLQGSEMVEIDFVNDPRIIKEQRIAVYKGYRGGGYEIRCGGLGSRFDVLDGVGRCHGCFGLKWSHVLSFLAKEVLEQVLWLQNKLLEYGYNFMQIKIHVDNESAICFSFGLQALVCLILGAWIKGRLGLKLKGYLINDGYADLVQHADKNELAIPKKTKTGKELSNPLIAGSLPKTTLPTLLIKIVNDDVWLQALIDGKKVVITEASIRHDLQLNDAEGTSCLPNAVVFEELARMGAKTTSWNEFSSTMASAIICLANNQKFNFLKYILDNLKKSLEADVPFYMFHRKHKPRRKDRKDKKETEVSPTELHTEGHVLIPSNDPLPSVIEMKSSHKAKIAELESKVEKLEEENMSLTKELKSFNSKVDSLAFKETIVDKEKSSKQRRKITDIDADAKVNLENVYNLDLAHKETVLSMQDVTDADGKEVAEEMVKVITNAKIIVDEVSTTGGELNAANEEPAKGIVFHDVEESKTRAAFLNVQVKDKGKAKLVEGPEVLKSRKAHIAIDEEVARMIEAEWNADMQDNIDWNKFVKQDSGFKLTVFSDVDHAGCIDTRKITSGGIQFLGDKLVSWMSKKQDCTAMSIAEAEYLASSASCAQSAIAISCKLVQHSRTNYIHTRYHFIKERVENGIIELYFVRTEYQLADMFTKALPEDRF